MLLIQATSPAQDFDLGALAAFDCTPSPLRGELLPKGVLPKGEESVILLAISDASSPLSAWPACFQPPRVDSGVR
jgi:hypothetical protein